MHRRSIDIVIIVYLFEKALDLKIKYNFSAILALLIGF